MTSLQTEPAGTDHSDARVAAVVVTYNRLEKLKTGLDAVLSQDLPCEWVVVVNNNSTDGTREYLDTLTDPRIVVRHLQENRGGAGGFEYGMALGVELGAEHVWVMDDDCYPTPSSLRELVTARQAVATDLRAPVPFACSVVKWIDGSLCEMNNPITSWDWPRPMMTGHNSLRVDECTFVSVLFPAYVLKEAGLPLADYFIWYDDKEYTKRLTRLYAPGIIVLDSVVIHDMPVNAGVNYRQIDAGNVWKFATGARNQASFRLAQEGDWAYKSYCRRVTDQMDQGNVHPDLQKIVKGALKEATTFRPEPRFPEELRGDLMLEAGSHADAPAIENPPVPVSIPEGAGTGDVRSKLPVAALMRRISRRQPQVNPGALHRAQVRLRLLKEELDELDRHSFRTADLVDSLQTRLRVNRSSTRSTSDS